MGTSGYMTSGAGGSSSQIVTSKKPRGWNNHTEWNANRALIKMQIGCDLNRAERRALKYRKVVP